MEEKVQYPAIALMVVAALDALVQVFSLVMNSLSIGLNGVVGMNSQTADQGAAIANMVSGTFALVIAAVGLLASLVTIFGGWKMYRFESYGMAMTAAILACIPCFSCCCVAVPIGIWSLVVLTDANVKASFRS